MDELDCDLLRKQVAREAYVKWRMNDLPAVYTNLMPVTYDAHLLWISEQAIRRQHRDDLKFVEQPWRRLGPPCHTLDYSNLSGQDLIEFSLGVEIPPGLTDLPKAGRWEELSDEIARQREASPEWQDFKHRIPSPMKISES